MKIIFTEPVAPRYIYIHQATNTVHLMVPVVGGLDISTDNTCKVAEELTTFFKVGAIRELTAYQDALEFDIAFLESENPVRHSKESRLRQIKMYVEAVDALGVRYSDLIKAFLKKPTNLYSIQLCPTVQDNISEVINPVFSILRSKSNKNISKSILYNWMHRQFPTVVISEHDPKTKLIHAVLEEVDDYALFEAIQKTLTAKAISLFGISIDFTKTSDGVSITQDYIDELMGFTEPANAREYIEALMGSCALDLIVSTPESSFDSISDAYIMEHRTEQLSIMTQFFLAHLNVHCKARDISQANFGKVLDASFDLSKRLVNSIVAALSKGSDVEKAIYLFFNAHPQEFLLAQVLDEDDLVKIKQNFETNYRTVTATKENPHMDDFMVLDGDATGERAKFFKHQGGICLNFAELVPADLENQAYFDMIRGAFVNHPITVPHHNNWVCGSVDTDEIVFPSSFASHQFLNLPQKLQEHFINLPGFYERQLSQLLDCVAKGKQTEAKGILGMVPRYTQLLLSSSGILKDYSGRQFNCTAFEYAYWAKDVYMCRMLIGFMHQETKDCLFNLLELMHKNGLCFVQNKEIIRTPSYDLSKLIDALDKICACSTKGHRKRKGGQNNNNLALLHAAQLDAPAHVIQEYCQAERSFRPVPNFKDNLSRTLSFYHSQISKQEEWFTLNEFHQPLALFRGEEEYAISVGQDFNKYDFWVDLDAIICLAKTRQAELELIKLDLHLKENVRLSSLSLDL